MKKDSFIIFESIGEAAKDLMGTAVVASLKLAHPERKIIVISHFPEIWMHNPNVFRVYKAGMIAYFYDEYVKDKDTLICRHDPYTTTDYAYGRKHIIDIWCYLCGVPRAGTMPSLHFTWREKEAAGKLTTSPLPLFYIHSTGSGDVNSPVSWAKDIPPQTAQDVVNKMNAKGYLSVQIREAHQQPLQNVAALEFNLRQMLCSIQFSAKRLFIDSFMLQSATALGLPSVATYTTGTPEVTGYEMHKSIMAFSHLNAQGRKMNEKFIDFVDSYKEGYDFMGAMRACPYAGDALYDADEIVKILES